MSANWSIWYTLTADEKVALINGGVRRKLSTAMIADEIGCTRNCIIGFAYRHNIHLPTPKFSKARAAPKRQHIVASYEAGETPKKIAHRLNRAVGTIYHALSIARLHEGVTQ